MPPWKLQTLGSTALIGADRTIPLHDPMLIAFIAVLAVAGDAGVAEGELQLLLTPDAKREAARRELSRLVGRVRELLGESSLSTRPGERYTLAPQALSLDVELRANDSGAVCAEFLRDLRIGDAPEFDEWLAATRQRVRARVTAIPQGVTRRRKLVGAVVAAAVLVVVASGYYLTAQRLTGFAPGDVIMLADVANQTGDTLFGRGILTAASVALGESRRVRLYSRARLPAVYALMKISDRATALDYELAQDVAERDHVRWVLGLTVARATEGYRIGARIADVDQHLEIADLSTTAQTKSNVIGALDELLVRVRHALGESRWITRRGHTPLPLVTTASLEALRSYAEGSSAWSASRFEQARELWQRAVDLDTGFAMAYGSLGSWHYYHHDRLKGEHFYEEALKRSARLTEWERLRLLDGQATYRGNLDSALVLSRTIAERFPSVNSWYGYGTSLLQRRRHEDAIISFRRALTFDSLHVNSWLNLATSSKALNRYDDAIRFYERAGQIDSSVLYTSNINNEYGGALVHAGRLADAEAVFRHMVAGDEISNRMLGLRSLGWLALWQGRLYEAIGNFQQSIEAAHQANNPLGEGRNRMLLAGVYRTANRMADANAEITRALLLAREPTFDPNMLAALVFTCQQLDRSRDAESIAALLHQRVRPDSRVDQTAEAYANGVVMLLHDHPDSALAYFRRAADFPVRTQQLMSTAEAFQALGQRDSVRTVLSAVVDADGFGAQAEDDWLRAPLLLADALLALGDSVGAVKRYQDVATRWRDAPQDMPDLVKARSRLAALARVRR